MDACASRGAPRYRAGVEKGIDSRLASWVMNMRTVLSYGEVWMHSYSYSPGVRREKSEIRHA